MCCRIGSRHGVSTGHCGCIFLLREATVVGDRYCGVWFRHRHVHLCTAHELVARGVFVERNGADRGRDPTQLHPLRYGLQTSELDEEAGSRGRASYGGETERRGPRRAAECGGQECVQRGVVEAVARGASATVQRVAQVVSGGNVTHVIDASGGSDGAQGRVLHQESGPDPAVPSRPRRVHPQHDVTAGTAGAGAGQDLAGKDRHHAGDASDHLGDDGLPPPARPGLHSLCRLKPAHQYRIRRAVHLLTESRSKSV